MKDTCQHGSRTYYPPCENCQREAHLSALRSKIDSLQSENQKLRGLLERVNVKLSLSPIHLTIFDDLLSDLAEFKKI